MHSIASQCGPKQETTTHGAPPDTQEGTTATQWVGDATHSHTKPLAHKDTLSCLVGTVSAVNTVIEVCF